MACERLRALRETFLDGELPSVEMLELQVHVDGCAECSEAVSFSLAVRKSTAQLVQGGSVVSEAFRARLSKALRAADREERSRPLPSPWRSRRFADVRRLGLAALSSAAVMALWMQQRHDSADAVARKTAQDSVPAVEASLGPDEYLERLIDYHTAPPPPQVTEPTLLSALERDVGVRMRLPSLTEYGAEWQWASVVRVRGDQRPAAYLRFRTADSRNVTLYVYNPQRLPLHAVLTRRMFREEPLYADYRRGFSIAAQLRDGVGYAVATDMSAPLSAELVRAISTSAVAH